MTVTARPKDVDGSNLDTQITGLKSQLALTTSALTKEALNQRLDTLQRELVSHYLSVGRLTASSILSTMT